MSRSGGGNSRTYDLQAEAAAMETKLAELRKQMEKERAKREALVANAAGPSSLWKNGGNGLLRTNFRNKQGAGQGPGQGKLGGHDTASKPQAPPANPAPLKQAMAIPPDQVSLAGVKVTTEVKPVANRKVEILRVQDEGSVEGTACGSDATGDLLSGSYNEADAQKSFLEALYEWRRGNQTASKSEDCAPSTSSRPSSAMQVQTEVASRRALAIPSSKMTYFDKLVLNTASKQAGEVAGGKAAASSFDDEARPGSSDCMHTVPETSGLDCTVQQEVQWRPPNGGPRAPSNAEAKHRAFSLLDKLEELEMQAQKNAKTAAEQAEDDLGDMTITTQQGYGLTKKVRLPDSIIIPDNTP